MGPCATGEQCEKAAAKLGLSRMPVVLSQTRRHGLLGLAQTVGVLLLLGLLAVSSIGCGPAYPPDERVVMPQIAVDNQDNVIALYQVSNGGRGPITYLQKLGPDGGRLWGEKGVRLDEREPDYPDCLNVETSSYPQMVAVDTGGNTTVFWIYQGQIYAEKLDSEGSPLWRPERLVVGAFPAPGRQPYTRWTVAAGVAGATIVWTDARRNLAFQSIDGDGNLLWTASPLDSNANELEARRDSDGNTWLLWADMHTRHIYLQVIDKTGTPVWSEARELYDQPSSWHEYKLWLAVDGLGGVVAAWRYSDDTPVEVHSVSIGGEVQISPAGVFFGENDSATLPEPTMDGEGGLVALWAAGGSVLAQRIDSQGQMAWGEDGVVVANNLAARGTESPHFQGSDQPGGTVVSWEADTADGLIWRAQRIDTQGNLLWGIDGVTISTVVEGGWRWQWSATTSDGAAILSGVATENAYRESRIQKVDTEGNVLWGKDGIRLDDWNNGG